MPREIKAGLRPVLWYGTDQEIFLTLRSEIRVLRIKGVLLDPLTN